MLLYCSYWKKSSYTWTHSVQIHVVQGSSVFCSRIFRFFLLFKVHLLRKQIFLLTLKMSHKRSVAAFLLRDFLVFPFPLSFSHRKIWTFSIHRDMIKWKHTSLVCALLQTHEKTHKSLIDFLERLIVK